MLFMNEYEIESALSRVDPDLEPVLAEAVVALANLAAWTNDNSDGWPYWSKPCQAAKALQQAILDHQRWERSESRSPREGAEMTPASLSKALRPVKSFLTRQGAESSVLGAYRYRLTVLQ